MDVRFTNAVKALIAYFGGSQAKAAAAVGVTQPTISAWLNKGHAARPINAMRAQEATGGAVRAVDLCPELREL